MDGLARLVGVLSLLTSFRLGPWRRARGERGRGEPSFAPIARKRSARQRRPQRTAPGWADALIGVLWVASLLFVLGYLALKGEVVIAGLEGVVLASPYSMEP